MDCIAQIMEFYHKKAKEASNSIQFNKVYLSTLLIKLMKNFNGKATTKKENLQLQNCLILLINLFSNNDSPDHYDKKGKGVNELTRTEKNLYREILTNEFLHN